MSAGARAVPRIVVGVDGSMASAQALRWAMRQAEVTGAVAEATVAWDIPTSYGFGPTVCDGEDLAGAAEQSLAAAVDDAHSESPNVAVQQRVLRGGPGAMLVDAAKDADLLVVGSRGHGGFVGALLGSVSEHCVHHASCPVVVVRSGN